MFLLITVSLWGQATDGNVTGRVHDPNGGGIAGAAVQLQNAETGVAYWGEAGAEGIFRIQNVPAGRYRLSAKADGFAPASILDVAVRLNQTATIDVGLRVASLATQVDVTDAPALIDTTTSQITSTTERQALAHLPTAAAAMGVLKLALLAGGVASSGGLGVGDGPSVGGQRPRANGFTIEGVDNNRKDVTGRNVAVSAETVAEVTALHNQC